MEALSVANFISIPIAVEKSLTEQSKRLILQREIFPYIEAEDMRMLNWKRYVSYLKKYKVSEGKLGRKDTIKMWKKCADKEFKQVRPMNKKSFGFFLSHVSSDDMFAVKSNVMDRHNRGESPTCYIYSLSKGV